MVNKISTLCHFFIEKLIHEELMISCKKIGGYRKKNQREIIFYSTRKIPRLPAVSTVSHCHSITTPGGFQNPH